MNPTRRTLLAGALVGLASGAALSARADEKGDKILREAFDKLHQAQTMTAEMTIEQKITGQPTSMRSGTVVLKKPNLLNVTLMPQSGARRNKQMFVSDGTYYFNYTDGTKNYMRQPIGKNATEFTGEWEGEVDSFFGGAANADKVNAEFVGTETIDGVPCNLVNVRVKQAADNRVIKYAIGQKDHLIRRTSWTTKLNESLTLTQTNRLSNIKLGAPAASALFAFVPPKDATLYDPAAQLQEMEKKLVAEGQDAPPFEVTDPKTKNRISLAKMLDGRKAVLVNFWFYN